MSKDRLYLDSIRECLDRIAAHPDIPWRQIAGMKSDRQC